MDAQRLLGMLNGPQVGSSATSPPPQAQGSHMASSPATLQSLLSQLQSPAPPTPQPQGERDPPPHLSTPPPSNMAEHFRGAGMHHNIPLPPPSQLSGMGGYNHPRLASPGSNNAQSLLATLMSGASTPSATPSNVPGLPFTFGQPVIDHSSTRVPLARDIPLPNSPAPPNPFSAAVGRPNKSASPLTIPSKDEPQPPANVPESTAVSTPVEEAKLASPQVVTPATQEPAPSASKFHFVSPFDAFDQPRAAKIKPAKRDVTPSAGPRSPLTSKPSTPKAATRAVPQGNATATKSKTENSQVEKPVASAVANTAAEPVAVPEVKKKAEPMPVLQRISAPSGDLPSQALPIDSVDFTFDVARPYTESILSSKSASTIMQVASVKTTVMTAGMARGRKVATSTKYVAYSLAKGKVRVIYYATGANVAVVLVPFLGSPEKVIEIDVCDKYLAALGEDGTVGIWSLLYDAQTNVLQAEQRSISGGKKAKVPARAIRWTTSTNKPDPYALIVAEGDKVFSRPDVSGMGDSDTILSKPVIDLSVYGERVFALSENGHVDIPASGISTKIDAPKHGGSWRSIIANKNNAILASTNGEYSIVNLDSAGLSSISSTFYISDSQTGEESPNLFNSSAAFDYKNNTLWIACWTRASLLAIKLEKSSTKFTSLIELPVGSTSDLAIDLTMNSGMSGVFYRHPLGVSAVALERPAVGALAQAEKLALTKLDVSNAADIAPVSQADAGSKTPSAPVAEVKQEEQPVLSKSESPKAKTLDVLSEQEAKSTLSAVPSQVIAGPKGGQPKESNEPIDYEKIEAIICQAVSTSVGSHFESMVARQGVSLDEIKNLLSTQEKFSQTSLAEVVSRAVQDEIKSVIPKAVKDEMRKSVLPGLQDILREQVEHHVGQDLANSILNSVETSVMGQVEKALVPHLGRTFTSVLSPVVEKSVRNLIDENLLPKFVAAVDHIPVEVSRAIHQEMLDVRKDVMIEQSAQISATESVMMTMTKSLAALSEQVQTLTREIEALKVVPPRTAPTMHTPLAPPPLGAGVPPHMMAPPPPGPHNMPPPPMQNIGHLGTPAQQPAQPMQQKIISPQPVLPLNVNAMQNLIAPTEDAEDVFLKAFSSLSEEDLVQFVISKMSRSAEYLPAPNEGRSPLSQAVLLTMIHRLSKCLDGRATESREYQAVMTWIFRAAHLIDAKDGTIQNYLPAVKKSLEDTFRRAMDQFSRSGDRSSATGSALQMMHQIIAVMNRP